jgi:hypothetical protein
VKGGKKREKVTVFFQVMDLLNHLHNQRDSELARPGQQQHQNTLDRRDYTREAQD